ncbi:RibD family protein [Thiovibrio frasassiensis]|uniref:Dihydrofolate reductase family protein n=1 Tax=Thiovibrio frasassiensis TaxID=2984131 RepID=A0A9X4MP84_9BACT|nr:dihydrofolate reductase family protein [Thiovibrio frasassiensis]MDG4476357.1 dihydrofolate reductase family protein [Thiovibrio frasassiensis]
MKVIIIAASTICGRIGPGLTGSSVDRGFLENMRALTDVSLLGAETLRQGDPEMRGPGGHLLPNRIRGVVSQSGDIPLAGKKIFQEGAGPLIFTGVAAAIGLQHKLGGLAQVVPLPTYISGGLSLAAALAHLAELGVSSVLVEGGGRLNYAFLQQGVVDEILLTLTPQLSGDLQAPSLCGGPGPLGDPFLPLDLVSCETANTGELFLKYRVIKGA